MRILFIYPVPPEDLQILRFQQGIGSISAVLKNAGHATELLTLSTFDRERLDETVRRFAPDLVGISLTSSYYPVTLEITAHLASSHHLPVVLGGIHPTLMPEESIETPGVFGICIGEGEYPMLELCDALSRGADPTGIANLWVRHNGKIFRNELRPLIRDLDALPFPDRDLFNFDQLLKQYPEAEFMGSRGCPYRCAYCANHALVNLYKGKGPYVRYRSIKNLLDEVETVVARYTGIGWIGFHDDTFTLNPRWLADFAEQYAARFRLPFWCNATARSVTPEVVEQLKRAGCFEVRIGVESGNDHIRMNVLDKKVTREEIVRAFRLLKEAGIERYAFNMVGLPGETKQTMEETIRLNQEIRPDHVFCSIFYPFPGTHARDICRENGWLTGRMVKSYFESEYALNQPGVTRRQVQYYHDIFTALVRWPRWSPLIRLAHRIPVTRTKTLWNVYRRLRAKCREWAGKLTGRRVLPE